MSEYITERRQNKHDVCPQCKKPGFRFREDNRVLICSWCGHEIDSKRETDNELLPAREPEMLKNGGY